MHDISDIRNLLSQSQYEQVLAEKLSKWKSEGDLDTFINFFNRQWVTSKFNNWQLFKTPPGVAMTNSPIERYNGDIKESFTKRLRHHLKSSMETFEDVISYESNHQKSFKHEFVVRKYMREQGRSILKNNLLIATIEEHKYKYKHFNQSLGYAHINTENKS